MVRFLKLTVNLDSLLFMGPVSVGCIVGRLTFDRRFYAAVLCLPTLTLIVVLWSLASFILPCCRRPAIESLRETIASFDTCHHRHSEERKGHTLRLDDVRMFISHEGFTVTEIELERLYAKCKLETSASRKQSDAEKQVATKKWEEVHAEALADEQIGEFMRKSTRLHTTPACVMRELDKLLQQAHGELVSLKPEARSLRKRLLAIQNMEDRRRVVSGDKLLRYWRRVRLVESVSTWTQIIIFAFFPAVSGGLFASVGCRRLQACMARAPGRSIDA